MLTTHLRRGRSVTVLAIVVITAALIISCVRRVQRRQALKRLHERHQSRQALVRYVQLRNQCSEEVAYQRLASFVKRRVPLDEQPSIDYMVAHARESLLELAQSILEHNPDEIDEI